jgi:tetratricopeptide (TPR) repeat protein
VKRIEASTPTSILPPPRLGSPLVGRSDLLASLKPMLNQARLGRGFVCALIGEAGIGKTRLAEALEHRAQRNGFAVTWCHCHPFGDVPALWPFVKLMRAWENELEVLGVHARGHRDGAPDDRGNHAWPDIVLSVLDMIEKRAAERPQLIVLEDVQWADGATLEVLAHLLSIVTHHRLLLVMTVRDQPPPDLQRRRLLKHIVGHRDCMRVTLTRLTHGDVEAYVQKLLGKPHAAVAKVVFAKSEGVPFFMVELLRPFVEGDRPQPADIRLPEPALNIVRQNLECLSAKTLEILAAASVLGPAFDLGMLSQITQRAPQELLGLLEAAVTMHVITAPRRSSAHWRFSHHLIREALYKDMPAILRVNAHARTAHALAARARSGPVVSRADIALHMLAGLPVIDGGEAIAGARQAAIEFTSVGAYADASALLRSALDAFALHPKAGPKELCELLFELARCERAAGEPFSQHLERAVTIANGHAHREVLAATGRSICGSPGTVCVERANDLLEQALAALPQEARGERSMLLSQLSWTPPHNWQRDEVAALLDQAERLTTPAHPRALRTVLHARLYYAGGPDDFVHAEELCHTLENLERSRGPRKRAAWALEPCVARMVAHLQRGDLELARRAADGYGAAARTLRHAELLWHYDRMLIVMRMNAGEYVYSGSALAELKRRAERLQLFGRKTLEAIDFGELQSQTTIQPTPSPAAIAEWRPRRNDSPLAFAVKLRMLCQLRCVDAAQAELAAFDMDRLRDIPSSRDYLATLGHIAHACVETGDRQKAELLYALLSAYPQLCLVSMSLHSYGPVSRTLARLAALLEEPKWARAHYTQALIDAERFGLLPQLAWTRYQFAELLRGGSSSELEQARALLSSAQTLAKSLGMQPLNVACQKRQGTRTLAALAK